MSEKPDFHPPTDLVWSDAFLLGYGPMDTVHEEFVEIVSAMVKGPDEGLLASLERFAEHARSHFGTEDQWMKETEFPARECHTDEHAAVMSSVEEVLALARSGNTAQVRPLAQELARWFPGHADYLDSALAHWMFKRSHGGKPVVLRRLNLTQDATP